MVGDEPFLRAILADPADDAPWLIYADWLEERGDPRSEFIRAQCELARLSPSDPRRPGLEARELALLKSHQKRWAEPLAGLVENWAFHRGLVWHVTMRPQQFLSHAEHVCQLAPVRGVTFWNGREDIRVDDLATCPSLRRKVSVGFATGSVVEVQDMYGGQGVSTPGYDNRVGDAGAEALAAAPFVDGLTALNLSGNGITARGAQALAGSAQLANLCWLDLSRNGIGGSAIQALGRAAWRWLGRQSTGTPGAGVRALVDSPYLTRLDLRKNHLSAEDEQALRQRFGDRAHF